MPSKREVEEYKLLSDEALQKFRIFCAAGKFPRPDQKTRGAFDQALRMARDEYVDPGTLRTVRCHDRPFGSILAGPLESAKDTRLPDHGAFSRLPRTRLRRLGCPDGTDAAGTSWCAPTTVWASLERLPLWDTAQPVRTLRGPRGERGWP
jgi:hypothetical protein